MPTFTIVAGPNGSGKTTLTTIARSAFQESPILDPDATAKYQAAITSGGGSAMDAGREVLRLARGLLKAQQSFAVETTLSGNTYLRMMREAKALGYRVVLFFVGTEGVEINLQRVKDRVVFRGHGVPELDQRRRYPRSMANLQKAYALADEAVLFDNSGESHRRFAVKDAAGATIYSEVPEWAAFLRS